MSNSNLLFLALAVAVGAAWWSIPQAPETAADEPAAEVEVAAEAAEEAPAPVVEVPAPREPAPREPRVGPRSPPQAPDAAETAEGEEAQAAAPPADPEVPEDTAAAAAFAAMSAEAHVEAGEQAFAEGDIQRAYDHYLAVIEADPDHQLAAFALYKLAWVEFNADDLDAAINDLRLLLSWVQDSEKEADEALALAASRDLANWETEAALRAEEAQAAADGGEDEAASDAPVPSEGLPDDEG